MTNRLPEKVTVFLSLILLLISGTVSSQDTTSIDYPEPIECPGNIIYIPINVNDIQAIDSIYLSIQYNPENFKFLTFRQINPILNQNGTALIDTIGDNVISFRWDATPGQTVSMTNSKLFELGFEIQSGDSLFFDESISMYRDTSGGNIPMTYVGDRINMYPQMSIEIEEVNSTCPGECDANIAAFVTGGLRPYQIRWRENQQALLDSIFTGACGNEQLKIKVTDANGCVLDTIFHVTALDSVEVSITADPDTIYMQNPVINFSFEGDDSVVDWYWDFGDNSQQTREEAPIHLYGGAANPDIESYTARLVTTSESGCTQITEKIMLISELPIFIPNVFTPGNQDGSNDYFKIAKKTSDSEKVPVDKEYIRMELVVFDRWGRKVYENNNYRNDWDGDRLPEGTYFYRLNTFGYYKNESFKGSVTILR